MPADALLTPAAAAALLGLSRRRVLAYIAAGDLPAENIGSATARGARWVLRRADVETFAQKPRRPAHRPTRAAGRMNAE